ncbi:MAG: glycosyltransferase family 1 protein [Pseudomonadota bacterium]
MTRYLLDVSRSISRVGMGFPTGVDRVEHAYISEISKRDPAALALVRAGSEFMVLELEGLAANLRRLMEGEVPGRLAFRDALRLKIPRPQRLTRSFLRNHSLSVGTSIGKALGRQQPEQYLNVGHSNLDQSVLSHLRALGTEVSVLVHDLIPLEYPQYTRPRVIAGFTEKMKATAQFANRIICNSQATADAVGQKFASWGPVPDITVAHLGVTPAPVMHAPAEVPNFVILGTVEPRKNHAVLLKAWEQLADDDDSLVLKIIGRRGWMNEDVFRWLDTNPLAGRTVMEMPDVDDTALTAHLSSARALLFPSFAEGFGLPALEAAQMGLPVICADLPVFHEILGDYATYLDPTDPRAWADCIRSVAQMTPKQAIAGAKQCVIPRWDSHFRHVLGSD